MSAEMCDGATGCASGSHACTGTMPAFMPKPKKTNAKAMEAQVTDRFAARMASKVKPLPKPAITPKPSNIARPPTWAMIRSENQRKSDGSPSDGQIRRAHGFEGETVAETGYHTETEQYREAADVGHEQVQKRRAPVGGVLMLVGHEKIRRDRHEFPRDHEYERVVREQHQEHSENEKAREKSERRQLPDFCVRIVLQVPRCVETHREHQQADDAKEETRKDVQSQVPLKPG